MTDTMRDKFEESCAGRYNLETENGIYTNLSTRECWYGYKAAQADARALVGELYDYIMNDECTQYLPEKLLTKARAFMEGKNVNPKS